MEAVLHRCKIRDHKIVPDRDTEPVTFGWADLCARFAGHHQEGSDPRRKACATLRRMMPGAYVGFVKPRGEAADSVARHLFLYESPGRDNSLEAAVAAEETFATRVYEVWKVIEVSREVARSESGTGETLQVVRP